MLRSVLSSLVIAFVVVACKPKDPVGLVPEAGTVTTTAVDAGPATVDVMQCAGCAGAAVPAWTFAGMFRDDKCTDPLAQTAPAACAVIAALGPTALTFGEDAAPYRTGQSVNVNLTEQVAPEAPRYRKAGNACVRANESATDLTPAGCTGQRVCRDATGALTCTGTCRTLSNGCPDFEETRLYAAFTDPAKGTKTVAAGNGLEKLRACCNAIAAEGKRLGASPEGGMILQAAAQCTQLVNAAGPNGNAPELAAIKPLLAGRNIPGCAGL